MHICAHLISLRHSRAPIMYVLITCISVHVRCHCQVPLLLAHMNTGICVFVLSFFLGWIPNVCMGYLGVHVCVPVWMSINMCVYVYWNCCRWFRQHQPATHHTSHTHTHTRITCSDQAGYRYVKKQDYIYKTTNTNKHTHTHTCIYMYIHIHMYICIHIYIYTYIYTHTHIYICICINPYLCNFICMYVCIYIYVCLRLCACMYIHVCVCDFIYWRQGRVDLMPWGHAPIGCHWAIHPFTCSHLHGCAHTYRTPSHTFVWRRNSCGTQLTQECRQTCAVTHWGVTRVTLVIN